jgi:hypothetical protein
MNISTVLMNMTFFYWFSNHPVFLLMISIEKLSWYSNYERAQYFVNDVWHKQKLNNTLLKSCLIVNTNWIHFKSVFAIEFWNGRSDFKKSLLMYLNYNELFIVCKLDLKINYTNDFSKCLTATCLAQSITTVQLKINILPLIIIFVIELFSIMLNSN